jgi:hypothetical protein
MMAAAFAGIAALSRVAARADGEKGEARPA